MIYSHPAHEDVAKAVSQFKNGFISFSLFSALCQLASHFLLFQWALLQLSVNLWRGAVAYLELKTHRD